MTIDSQYQSETFSVNPARAYTFSFEYQRADYIEVWETDGAGGFLSTEVNVDWQLTQRFGQLPLYAGGVVTFTRAPTPGYNYVQVRRNTDVTQLLDYDPYRPFPAESSEFALDKITLILQEHDTEIDGLRGAVGDTDSFVKTIGDEMTGNLAMLGDSELRIESSNNPAVQSRLYGFQFGYNVTILDGNAALSNVALRGYGPTLQDNYDLVAAGDGFLYWRNIAIADQNGVIGGGGSALPPGTVTNQSIRWDGAAWVPTSELLIDPNSGDVTAANDVLATRVVASGSVIGDLLASSALVSGAGNIVSIGALGVMADTGIAWADIIPDDAPSDGGIYARQNSAWVISGAGGGVDPADDITWSGEQTFTGDIVIKSPTTATSFVTAEVNALLGLIITPENGLGFSIQAKNLGGTTFGLTGGANAELRWNGNLIADINGLASTGVTSFAGRTGAVTTQVADYSAFYQPLGNYVDLSTNQSIGGLKTFTGATTTMNAVVGTTINAGSGALTTSLAGSNAILRRDTIEALITPTAKEVDIAFGQVTGSSGAVKSGSRGVSSTTRTSTGQYRVNFSSAAASTTAQSLTVNALTFLAIDAACSPVSSTEWTVTVFNSAGTAVDWDFNFQRIK